MGPDDEVTGDGDEDIGKDSMGGEETEGGASDEREQAPETTDSIEGVGAAGVTKAKVEGGS